MKLTSVKCPNCNANLKLKANSKKMECEYCGSTVLLDDDTIKIKHMVEGQITEEQEFINAETNLNKIKDYNASYEGYLSLSKRYVNNEEIWIGLLRSLTHDFTYKYGSESFKKEYQKYWKNYIALAEEKDINKYKEKYKKYVDSVKATDDKSDIQSKDIEECYVLATIFGGWFGLHKFMKKEKVMGIVYLLTAGLLFIGWIVDIIKECNKWPDSKQLKTAKYIGMVIIAIMGICYIEYDILSALFLILSGLSIIDYFWNKFKIKNKILRVWTPIILFILAVTVSPDIIPESLYGTWKCTEDNCMISEIQIDYDSTLIINDKKYESYHSEYKDNVIYIEIDESKTYYFKYSEEDNTLCKLNDEIKCEYYYKLEK